MADNTVNNKRILKNTLFLYLRMIIVMGISLYTVRAILDILGVVDYGIYNVVGGVVAMFSFLNGTLATSSQRYFSISLANHDIKDLNKQLCLNVTVYLIAIIVITIILETIGLWFVNNKMVIPDDRIEAANIVYQLSILTFAIQLISVPYNALVIAYEKMSMFAYLGILEAVFKLVIVFVLLHSTIDNLVLYGVLQLVFGLVVSLGYIIYCNRKLEGSRFNLYWNTNEVKSLLGFTGWHFMGTVSVTIRSQGINILLNMFFSPAINAARAVAYQIYNAISQLSSNFFMAVKPQIYKSYASNALDDMYKLVIRSTIMCVFLVSLISVPVILSADYILGLWLKDVPEYTVLFTQLVLINGIIDTTSGPTIASALATGNIKKYEIWVSFLIFLNLPLSYILLLIGAEPWITMVVSIVLSYISVFVRYILLRKLIPFPIKAYFFLICRISILTCLIIYALSFIQDINSFGALILIVIISSILHILSYAYFILDTSDRKMMIDFVKSKIRK